MCLCMLAPEVARLRWRPHAVNIKTTSEVDMWTYPSSQHLRAWSLWRRSLRLSSTTWGHDLTQKKKKKLKRERKKPHPALKNIINFAYHFPRPEVSVSLEVQMGKTGKTKMKWVSICCLIFRECPVTCGRKAAVSCFSSQAGYPAAGLGGEARPVELLPHVNVDSWLGLS